MDSAESSSPFIDPQRLFTTALGISVGVAWNAAMREVVDDYLPTDESTGALVSAVLITVLAVIVWAMANLCYSALAHFTRGDLTLEKPSRAHGRDDFYQRSKRDGVRVRR